MHFLDTHRDVIEAADALTRNGPVLTDTVLRSIAHNTGKDETTCMQALYSSGRIWYTWLVPGNWWQRGTLSQMLEKSRTLRH